MTDKEKRIEEIWERERVELENYQDVPGDVSAKAFYREAYMRSFIRGFAKEMENPPAPHGERRRREEKK